jgi:Zn-dependent M16 (insulinase) family peptidase
MSEKWNLEKAEEMLNRHMKILNNNPTKEQIVEVVKEYPYRIKYIDNPPEEAILIVIEVYAHNITYIQPHLISETVQRKVFEQDPTEMKYIDKIADTIQIEMVKQNHENIKYIHNPCEEAQVISVRENPNNILYINGLICSKILNVLKENL